MLWLIREKKLVRVKEIAKLNPAFMSVTYGAGGGTSETSASIAENIMKHHGTAMLAHLTCVSSTKETIHTQLKKLQDNNDFTKIMYYMCLTSYYKNMNKKK